MSPKSISRYKKLLTTQVEDLYAISHFNTKHFSALNYAQDFRTTVKESLKRTMSSKWATLTDLLGSCGSLESTAIIHTWIG